MTIVTNNSVFGENLKYIRESSGFSFWYIAKLLNITEQKLNHLETGECMEIDALILRILQNLLEEKRDKMADLVDKDPDCFRRACGAMGGRPIPERIFPMPLNSLTAVWQSCAT